MLVDQAGKMFLNLCGEFHVVGLERRIRVRNLGEFEDRLEEI